MATIEENLAARSPRDEHASAVEGERHAQRTAEADGRAAAHERNSVGSGVFAGLPGDRGSQRGSTAQPADEVTGIRSAVARLDAIAGAHASHAGDEGFIGSLVRMEVGADDQQRTRAAQEQSRNAAQMWADAAASVRANNMPVAEAYSASPGAGNKQAQTNE